MSEQLAADGFAPDTLELFKGRKAKTTNDKSKSHPCLGGLVTSAKRAARIKVLRETNAATSADKEQTK